MEPLIPYFRLPVRSVPGFKARVDVFASVLCHLQLSGESEESLIQHSDTCQLLGSQYGRLIPFPTHPRTSVTLEFQVPEPTYLPGKTQCSSLKVIAKPRGEDTKFSEGVCDPTRVFMNISVSIVIKVLIISQV